MIFHWYNFTISQLNDGSGIAATLISHKAMYHKICRSYCSSSRVKRARGKLDKEAGAQNSPKKLRRSSGETHPPANIKCCIIYECVDQSNLYKVVTNVVDANLKSWAKTNNNFHLLGRLMHMLLMPIITITSICVCKTPLPLLSEAIWCVQNLRLSIQSSALKL